MANRNGNNQDNAIVIDDNDDALLWVPAPTVPHVKKPRPANSPPSDADQIDLTLSDDDTNADEQRNRHFSYAFAALVEQVKSTTVNNEQRGDHRHTRKIGLFARNTTATPSIKTDPPTTSMRPGEERGSSHETRSSIARDAVPHPPNVPTLGTPVVSALATQQSNSSPQHIPTNFATLTTQHTGQEVPTLVLSDEPVSQKHSTPPMVTNGTQCHTHYNMAKVSSPITKSMDSNPLERLSASPHPNHTQTVPDMSVLAHRSALFFGVPIGGLTNQDRHQTNSSHVELTINMTGATVHNDAEKSARPSLDMAKIMPAKARRTHGPSAAFTPVMEKAKKSVRTKDDSLRAHIVIRKCNPSLKKALSPSQSPLRELGTDPYSLADLQASIRRTRGKSSLASDEAIVEPDTIRRSASKPLVGEVPGVTSDFTEQQRNPDDSSLPAVHSATPHAQSPTETAQECRQLSSLPMIAVEAAAMLEDVRAASNQQTDFHLKGLEELVTDIDVVEPTQQPDVHIRSSQDAEIDIDVGQPLEEAAHLINADDIETACSAVEDCLRTHLTERHAMHAYTTASIMRGQRTCHERELRVQPREQAGGLSPGLPEKCSQYVSPFANMPAIQVPFDKKTINPEVRDITQETFMKGTPKNLIVKSSWVVPVTIYKSKAVVIPPFKEYVNLKTNILADNESRLLATPYFQDEDHDSRVKLFSKLPFLYEMKHDENSLLDLRLEQCRFFKHSVQAFLSELDISWDVVLYWLLVPDKNIMEINSACAGASHFESLLLDRSNYDIECFEREEQTKRAILFERKSKRKQGILSFMEIPTTRRLRIAAIACRAVFQECRFSIWYLAQQSGSFQKRVSNKHTNTAPMLDSTYKNMLCRVCHQHNCLFHGEIRQVPGDSWEHVSIDDKIEAQLEDNSEDQDRSSDSRQSTSQIRDRDEQTGEDEKEPRPAHFDDDSDVERIINYRLPANPNAFNACKESELIQSRGSRPPDGKFNSRWWLRHGFSHKWEKRKPFFPCSHEGSCVDAQCRCFRENINCEKTCRCSRECKRRFPGCSCVSTTEKRACTLATCLCLKFNRECDADVCGSCGAAEVLDPINRYNENVLQGWCCNVAIQRGVPRKTLLGHSEVHGFGLYMGEDIKKDEYIGEYTGETLSAEESDRRLTIYDYQQTLYLFRLNSKQEVDATYMGNKLRFINNAEKKHTNCGPKNLLCNTVFRLALYATTDMKAGTELFFDYNFPKDKTMDFKQPKGSKGKVIVVKDSKSNTEPKRKHKPTSTNAEQPSADRSSIYLATAKARAAKATKRAEALANEASQDTTTTMRTGPQHARKTAANELTRYQSTRVNQLRGKGKKSAHSQEGSNASDSGMDTEGSEYILPADIGSQDTQETQSSRVVPETDDEDDEDFAPEDTLEGGDENDVSVTDGEDVGLELAPPSIPRVSGRARKSTKKAVVAVKKKIVGARPGAGRKRKRPIVFNSSDEE